MLGNQLLFALICISKKISLISNQQTWELCGLLSVSWHTKVTKSVSVSWPFTLSAYFVSTWLGWCAEVWCPDDECWWCDGLFICKQLQNAYLSEHFVGHLIKLITFVIAMVLLKVVLIVVVLVIYYLIDADGIHSILMNYVDIIQCLD